MIITIKKGRHRSGLNLLGFFPMLVNRIKIITINFVFDPLTVYDLNGIDQQDWNKLGGIVFNPFKRNKDAILGGWRYNPATQLFDVTAYQNDEYAQNSGYGQGQALAHYKTLEKGRIEIRRDGNDYYYRFFKLIDNEWKELQAIEIKKTTRKRFRFAFRSGVWFGGNQKAPKTLKLQWQIKYR